MSVFLARAAGNKKSHFTIAHSYGGSRHEQTDLLSDNDLCEAISTIGDFNKKYRSIEYAKDVSDAIDKLTIDAAVQLGISDDYGSIQNDKRADFVIFDENPLDCDLQKFRNLSARMTVINGKIVYDAGADTPESWQDILKAELNDQQEQVLLEEYE
jgi:N-acetylglucosamine-6-phosphate deacetylase